MRKETIVLDGETSEMVREALLQTNSIFHMERDSKKDLRRAEDFQHILSLSFLLDFWSSGKGYR